MTASICKHDRLRRQCDECDMAEEIEALRTALAEAESKLAEVTAERDNAYERGRRRGREDVGRLHDALAEIERVLGRKPAPVEFLARAVAEVKVQKEVAESALARALEAMPTDKERPAISEIAEASYFKVPNGVGWRLFSGWLARLDAFRASQAATKGGEDD